ncbi:hypothetical protein J437_LFUL007314 [Ladona fulva]|uniref:Integrase catalytic domain-containing protein n=1 Tax=Ladona fulva TaxID=123851 RepID=A0A8K0KUV0_LADFU|nr:hypothetical protein J437_LFUL007314 [Ladona fulva]
MNKDVRKYVSTCENCQTASVKMQKVTPALHNVDIPAKVWHQVGVDLCSLPISKEGYIGICMVTDYFSKWMEAKPIRHKTAEEVAIFLYELICRYGCIRVQINDQEREFCNEVSRTLHGLTGTHQRITSAYHPQANGLVERSNRTIQRAMLKVLQEEQTDWVTVLDGVLFAFRTTRHRSTGVTPYELMFARKPILPVQCIINVIDDVIAEEHNVPSSMKECSLVEEDVQNHLSQIKALHAVVLREASKNIEKAQQRQKAYEVGDKVLVYNLRKAERKGDKVQLPYEGPYLVSKCFADKSLYELG